MIHNYTSCPLCISRGSITGTLHAHGEAWAGKVPCPLCLCRQFVPEWVANRWAELRPNEKGVANVAVEDCISILRHEMYSEGKKLKEADDAEQGH